MNDVQLTASPIAYSCALDLSEDCDPAHDLPGIPRVLGNSDCVPTGVSNAWGRSLGPLAPFRTRIARK